MKYGGNCMGEKYQYFGSWRNTCHKELAFISHDECVGDDVAGEEPGGNPEEACCCGNQLGKHEGEMGFSKLPLSKE